MSGILPKVSVVTITYGHQDYILDTIKSVLMQDYRGEIEFIIANDNSPDDTHRVVTEFLKTNTLHPNIEIKYTKHEKNLGMIPNFIWALEQARGKYVALCEGDDYWTEPSKLQKQVKLLEKNKNYSMCFTHQLVVSNSGEVLDQNKYEDKVYTTHDIVKGFIPGTQGIVFRNHKDLTALVSRYPNTPSGDRMLSDCCSLYGDIVLFPEFTAAYRQTGKGVWTSVDENDKLFSVLEEYIKFHLSIGLPANNEHVFKKVNGAVFYLLKKNKMQFVRNMNELKKLKSKYHIKSGFINYALSKLFTGRSQVLC